MNNPTTSNAGMGLGIAGLVLGILSVPLAIIKCTFVTGLVLGILGITLSAVAYSQARKANASNGMITAALIISIIGTSFAIIKMTNSLIQSRSNLIHFKEKIQHFEDSSQEIESAFKEGFESEFDKEMEQTLEDLEKDLDTKLEDVEIDLNKALEGLSDEQKAEKTGRALGKAIKGFVEELADTSDVSKK